MVLRVGFEGPGSERSRGWKKDRAVVEKFCTDLVELRKGVKAESETGLGRRPPSIGGGGSRYILIGSQVGSVGMWGSAQEHGRCTLCSKEAP